MKTKIYPIVYPNSLRKYRKAAGLRQHEVARALGLNSIERISKWENGHSIPKGKSLFHLAVLYRVPPQQLFSEMYETNLPNMASLGLSFAKQKEQSFEVAPSNF